jgi:uncharacterized membrane protein YjjP (DUF1212 family)
MSDRPRDRLEQRALRAWADLGRELSADTSLDRLVRRSSPGDPGAPTSIDAQLALLNALTGALHAYGLPAHRVEEALARVIAALGLRVQLVSQLTSFTVTVEHDGQQRTQVVRVQPGRSDLEKLSALHELVGRIERQELTVAEAARRIAVITGSAPRYGPLATTLCHGLSSASAAALLGATGSEALWAAPVGVLVGAAVTLAEPLRALQQLLPAACTLLAAVASFSLAHHGVPVRPLLLTLAGVVVLLPGLSTTMGIMELATGNLVSGTARLAGAAMTFLLMVFGVALGQRVDPDLVGSVLGAGAGEVLPQAVAWLAPGGAALSFAVLLRARPRDLPLVFAGCYVAAAGAWAGAQLLGSALGGFLGALVLGVLSHVHARWKDRPVALTLVPGTLLLVPGSLGFLGFSSLLGADASGAVEALFRTVLVAVSIASGTLVASLAVPPGRAI